MAEGDAAEFTVTLTGATSNTTSSADVVVTYEVGGDVTEDDYQATGGTLTIPAGVNIGTITIDIENDGVLDRGEMLTVTLTGANTAGSVVVPPGTATASSLIVDNSTVTLAVADADPDLEEGAAAMFRVSCPDRSRCR